jgi:hypothetical protein
MTKTLRVLAAVPATAGNIKIGEVGLNPYYGFETRYEDNIYRVPRNINNHAVSGGGVRGSWIVTNNLGLKVSAPIGEMHKVTAGYDLAFDAYKTQSKANNAFNQKVGVGYEFKGAKLNAKLADDYINTQDPAFNPYNAAASDLVQREHRWANTLASSLEYALGDKFFAGVDAQLTRNKYLSPSLGADLNTSGVTFGTKAGYKVAPKTKVFAAIHRTLLHYTEKTRQDNHRDWNVDFGVDGSLAPKLKGLVQVGLNYTAFDFDSAHSTRSRVSRHVRFLTQLDYAVTENGQFILALNRGTNDSSSTGSRYYVTSGASLAYNHKFGKASAGINGGVQYDKYSENFQQGPEYKTRRDDNYTLGVKTDYKFNEWATAGAAFTRNARFSTFSRQFNYRDNITAFNAKLSF